jgi:hypothetical protein
MPERDNVESGPTTEEMQSWARDILEGEQIQDCDSLTRVISHTLEFHLAQEIAGLRPIDHTIGKFQVKAFRRVLKFMQRKMGLSSDHFLRLRKQADLLEKTVDLIWARHCTNYWGGNLWEGEYANDLYSQSLEEQRRIKTEVIALCEELGVDFSQYN